jgi:hypothetical protein
MLHHRKRREAAHGMTHGIIHLNGTAQVTAPQLQRQRTFDDIGQTNKLGMLSMSRAPSRWPLLTAASIPEVMLVGD